MNITELLKDDTVILDLVSQSKDQVIDELVTKLDEAGRLDDKGLYKEAILEREAQSTTGIGEGIAIPHAKTKAVSTPAIAFGRSKNGIDYQALDDKPSHLFFMIAATEGANADHLETLSRLSTLLMDEVVREQLLRAETIADVLQAVDEKEKAVLQAENDGESVRKHVEGTDLILAVTACPTGIAHTYMAADALKTKAEEMKIDFKVETNGATGVKHRLTEDDIAQATAIIVAADKQVDMARFNGKPVIQVPVAQGIRQPDVLLQRALKQDAPIYNNGDQTHAASSTEKGQGIGFYRHLMNGVSNMLPLVVGGGILIALSFIFGIKSYDPNDPSYNAIAAMLHSIGADHAFALMIPVLAGFIAMSIADRPGLAPGLVGGFLASTTGAGFLGGLIAGFLAGYVVLLLKKIFSKLPASLEGIKPVLLYPLFAILITGVAMYLLGGPLQWIMNELTHWLEGLGTGNLVILGIVLGGMMAIDMGGPINKAAFTFGIAMIDSGNFAPHAAIMAGGMVPPLGLALATTLFKNRFTKQERESGKTCYVMGATFITEGAIPFAAADPIRVIPSCVIGSAVSGALAMIFKIGLPAPHGGIFVIPFVQGHWYLYVVAILIGSVVTALLVSFLKKPIKENV